MTYSGRERYLVPARRHVDLKSVCPLSTKFSLGIRMRGSILMAEELNECSRVTKVSEINLRDENRRMHRIAHLVVDGRGSRCT